MTTKENAAQAGQQGGKGNAGQLDYTAFIDQLTRLVLQRNNSTGYPFADAMKLAEQHGINEEDAIAAMRESRRFCTCLLSNGNLILSYKGRAL